MFALLCSLTLRRPRAVFAFTGEMVFSSDASYRGSFEGNKFHGFGRYEWNDGATYEGGWRENKCVRDGLNTLSTKNKFVTA